MSIPGLTSVYRKKKPQIKRRLKEFRRFETATNKDIFAELTFCLLTPGTKALNGDKAVKNLKRSGLLFNGKEHSISKSLRSIVRFHNNKASYIVAARRFFKNGKGIDIKSRLDKKNIIGTRNWLAKNVKGLGLKEASHFLRNIGLGRGLSILDVHILKNLKRYNVIKEIPDSINRRTYIEIEDKLRIFAKKVSIPIEELDLLFWSNQTGFIFK
ncbi:MAG: N-glycosylase/DNA lyase [Candidatus Omnitrophica bacterium]|nr:N-glycosylase/DNA lyase [Candidatus Omnitrophota bacterium]